MCLYPMFQKCVREKLLRFIFWHMKKTPDRSVRDQAFLLDPFFSLQILCEKSSKSILTEKKKNR